MSRNVELTALAGRLRNQGLDEAGILHELLNAPERGNLPEIEVRAIAKSAMGFEPHPPRILTPGQTFPDAVCEHSWHRNLNVDAYQRLGCVAKGKEFLTPTRDDKGNVVSSRRRLGSNQKYSCGAKALSEKGKPLGLIYPVPFNADGVIALVEGEMDVLAFMNASKSGAVIGTPGSNISRNMQEMLSRLLAGRTVILFFHPDDAGRKWRDVLTRLSLNAGCKVLWVPPVGDNDLDERLQKEASKTEALERMIDGAIDYVAREQPETVSSGDDDGRVPVEVSTDEHRVVKSVIGALASDDNLFQRAGRLVQIARGATPQDAIVRTSSASIGTIAPGVLREKISQQTELFKITFSRHGENKIPIHCPEWLISMIHQRGEWDGIRPLVAAVDNPIFTRDGRVLSQRGYDAPTGVFITSYLKLSVPEKPTRTDVLNAIAGLEDVINEFPWANNFHRSAWFAAVLTLLGRHAIAGPCPMFLLDKTTRGVGGSLVADLIGLIVSGGPMPRTSETGDDEEMRKRITSVLLAGDAAILIDNLTVALGGGALDALLTGTTWRDRILGRSEMTAELPALTVWFASGNNVQVKGDTVRRVLPIRMESDEEFPEERRGFKYPDLKAHVLAHRADLLSHALTLLVAFHQAGRPDQNLTPWGSFEAWGGLIRNCLVWAGLPDPCKTRVGLSEIADRERGGLAELYGALKDVFPGGFGISVSKIIEASKQNSELREALENLGCIERGNISSKLLAWQFRHARGRVIGGYKLEIARENSHKGHLWRLVCVSGEGGQGG